MKKKLRKKIGLGKMTISNLDYQEMQEIVGASCMTTSLCPTQCDTDAPTCHRTCKTCP